MAAVVNRQLGRWDKAPSQDVAASHNSAARAVLDAPVTHLLYKVSFTVGNGQTRDLADDPGRLVAHFLSVLPITSRHPAT
jgi:hypothetical protein